MLQILKHCNYLALLGPDRVKTLSGVWLRGLEGVAKRLTGASKTKPETKPKMNRRNGKKSRPEGLSAGVQKIIKSLDIKKK
jgi:hypothetical protein